MNTSHHLDSVDHIVSFDEISAEKVDVTSFIESVEKKEVSTKGVTFAILSNFISSISPICLGLSYRLTSLSAYEIMFWVSLIMCTGNYFTARYFGYKVTDLPPECRFVAFLRSLFGAMAVLCQFVAVQYISISKANILFFTAPLYMPLLGKIFLNESISRFDIISLFFGFAGVYLLKTSSGAEDTTDASSQYVGVTISLIGGLIASFAWICVRQLSTKCHFSVASFYFGVGSVLLSAFMWVYTSDGTLFKTRYDSTVIILLLLNSIVTFSGQITIVIAYQYEKAARVSVFTYLQTLLILIYDVMLFGKVITLKEVLGAVLIIGCNFSVTLLRFKQKID